MRRIGLGLLLIAALFGAPAAVSASVVGGGSGPVVAATSTPDGKAGWTVTSGGSVRTTGTAHSYGDASHLGLHAAIVGIAALPTGSGYWLLAADGGRLQLRRGPLLRLDRRHAPEPADRGHGAHGQWSRLLARGLRRRDLRLR